MLHRHSDQVIADVENKLDRAVLTNSSTGHAEILMKMVLCQSSTRSVIGT